MKAAVLGEKGVEVRDVPRPTPKPNEVLIKVRASSLNRADTIVAAGIQHGPVGGVGARLGLECSGEVEAVGSEVTGFKAGDRVMGSAPGGFAEYTVTDAGRLHRIPGNNMTYAQAACFPIALQTMHNAVVTAGRLKRGETLLIHGGSSGIGTTAIQLAKAFGAKVVTTAGSPEKCEACRKLGADVAVNYRTEDFVAITKEATGRKGAELIVDMVGGDYIERNYEAAAVEGRIVQIAFQGSAKTTVDFRRIMLKRLTHTGSTLRARSVADKAAIARAVEANVWPLIAAGKVKPVIHQTFPLADAAAAHALMESSTHIGKIVLTV